MWKDFVTSKEGHLSQENACWVSLGTEFRSSALTQRLSMVVYTCNLEQGQETGQSLKLLAGQFSWSVRLTADSVRAPASENKVSDEGRTQCLTVAYKCAHTCEQMCTCSHTHIHIHAH